MPIWAQVGFKINQNGFQIGSLEGLGAILAPRAKMTSKSWFVGPREGPKVCEGWLRLPRGEVTQADAENPGSGPLRINKTHLAELANARRGTGALHYVLKARWWI